MNTTNERPFGMALPVSILVVLFHIYYFDPEAFHEWGLMPVPVLKIMIKLSRMGIFQSIYYSKLLALALLILSLFGSVGTKRGYVRWTRCLGLLGCGAALYFGSCMYHRAVVRGEIPSQDVITHEVIYMISSFIGYLLLLEAGTLAARILHWGLQLHESDPFGSALAGFPQEERKLGSTFSINLPASYVFRNKKVGSWINIVNARRGVMVVGSPGSGKSRFIIEPCIRQLMAKGMAMFIYDFKYDTLTRLAYHLFREHRRQYPPGAAFYTINFSDVSRSHRCNLLDVAGLATPSDAFGVSRTLMCSLNRTWIHRQGEFFVESPINFVAALIWYLRKYQKGRYCTLPHVIELAQVGYEELFSVLSLEPEVRTLINPFVEAYRDGVMDMLDSQVSSANIPLGRLASPELYYILTGDDCNLEINHPTAPKVFCLGGDPRRQEALAPVLSLYIDQMNKLVNQPGGYPCALICDEFGTVRAYSTRTTVATGRSNNIVTILAIQDINQLRTQYSREEADELFNLAGNILCGQTAGETARRVSERFPRTLQEHQVVSTNSRDTSYSQSQQWTDSVTSATLASLSSGEFVGIVADDPDLEMERKAFHAKLIREKYKKTPEDPLPLVRQIDRAEIMRVHRQVQKDIQELVQSEMARMIATPHLRQYAVRRR